MKRIRNRILILMIIGLIGCTDYAMICSLHPFYLEKNVLFIPEIEGKWNAFPRDSANQNSIWKTIDTTYTWNIGRLVHKEVQKSASGDDSVVYKPQDKYLVKLMNNHSDSVYCTFELVVFRIGNNLYGDFFPVDNQLMANSRFNFESYLKVHTVARIQSADDQFFFSWLGAEQMKEMVEEKRVRARYEWINSSGRLLLTGSSKQLSYLIERYANQPRFIDWENQAAMLQLKKIKQDETSNPEV